MKNLQMLNDKLWKEKGHKFALGLVTNKRTSNGIKEFNYMKIAAMTVRNEKIGDLTPFSLISDDKN